jgi:hypothetical protein
MLEMKKAPPACTGGAFSFRWLIDFRSSLPTTYFRTMEEIHPSRQGQNAFTPGMTTGNFQTHALLFYYTPSAWILQTLPDPNNLLLHGVSLAGGLCVKTPPQRENSIFLDPHRGSELPPLVIQGLPKPPRVGSHGMRDLEVPYPRRHHPKGKQLSGSVV